MNILLIEPDSILANVYKNALEMNKQNTVRISSGAQVAIMNADDATPDLVILELQLIEHSGIEFLYEFRSYSEWQEIPVVLHTMVPFAEFTDNWNLLRSELGVRAYLYKPNTSLAQLRSYVEEQSLITT
jgi:DNA-binding response OmpR family regulator